MQIGVRPYCIIREGALVKVLGAIEARSHFAVVVVVVLAACAFSAAVTDVAKPNAIASEIFC
jgi:hypothetical protein